MNASYPIAIVGPGALGLSFAWRLAQRMPVALVARSQARADELRQGVSVGGARFVPEVFPSGDAPQADWVLVVVKANDTGAAARTAASMAPIGVLSLQNGWVQGVLREPFGEDAIVAQGVTTEAAFRRGNEITPSGAGETRMPRGFEKLAELLRAAGFNAGIDPEIAQARMRKLIVNACINPLTALYRIPNGRLCEPPHVEILRALAIEAATVLSAEELEMDDEEAVKLVLGVARATAKNRSSMLQDVEADRPTEMEFITGAILGMAAFHGRSAPTHEILYRHLRGECGAAAAIAALEGHQMANSRT
jgi:2-dehydropantoate 2-reductase